MAKALLVNSGSSLVLLYFSMLKQLGMSVNALEGFLTALEEIKINPPDIIFISLSEPFELNYEFIAACASINPDIPIVVMHIAFDRYAANNALRAGAKYALEEPVSLKQFETLLHNTGFLPRSN